MREMIKKITFWNAMFFIGLIMTVLTFFNSKNLDLAIYYSLLMILAYSFDRIEKFVKEVLTAVDNVIQINKKIRGKKFLTKSFP